MTSEAALRATVKKHLGIFGVLHRVENRCDKGTPDTAYALKWGERTMSGWLELKEIDLPKRLETPVNLKLRPGQPEFADDWTKFGGACFLLVQIGKLYLLFQGADVKRVAQGRGIEELKRIAVAQGYGTFPTAAVLRALSLVKPV